MIHVCKVCGKSFTCHWKEYQTGECGKQDKNCTCSPCMSKHQKISLEIECCHKNYVSLIPPKHKGRIIGEWHPQ